MYTKRTPWSTDKQDYRTFKITRMRNIEITDNTYSRELQSDKSEDFSIVDTTKITLKFKKSAWGMVYYEFEEQTIISQDTDSLIAEIYCTEDEWIYGHILSYGANVAILEPVHMREIIKRKLEENLKQYL